MVVVAEAVVERPDPAAAIIALGWSGPVRIVMDLFGFRLLIVADPDDAEIARRERQGLAPIVDPWLLRLRLDGDPDFGTRPAPVRLIGAMAARPSWDAARDAAGVFTAFGARAVLVPIEAVTFAVLAEAAVTGIGVVVCDDAGARCVAPAAGPVPVPRSHVHRLVEETVWAAASEAGLASSEFLPVS